MHKTLAILGVIGIFFLVIQLILCLRAKKIAIKLIPIYIIILWMLLAMLIRLEGRFLSRGISRTMFEIGIGATFVDAIAWIAYWIKGKDS